MNNQEMAKTFDELLRLDTYPIAMKFSNDEELPPKVKNATEINGYRLAVCQGMAYARRFGWSVGFKENDHGCPLSYVYLGLKEDPDFAKAGEMVFPMYAGTLEAGARTNAAECHIEVGSFKTIIVAPLFKADFDPDIVIIYGRPAHIIRLVQGAVYNVGGVVSSNFMGRCACGAHIAAPYKYKKCQVVIPAAGERSFAGTDDDECCFAIPKEELTNVVDGLVKSHKAGGARMPTPNFGIGISANYPPYYAKMMKHVGLDD